MDGPRSVTLPADSVVLPPDASASGTVSWACSDAAEAFVGARTGAASRRPAPDGVGPAAAGIPAAPGTAWRRAGWWMLPVLAAVLLLAGLQTARDAFAAPIPTPATSAALRSSIQPPTGR